MFSGLRFDEVFITVMIAEREQARLQSYQNIKRKY